MFESLVNVLLAALAVSTLIFVHELGHFLAAKAVGVRVEVFALGFWKKIVGFRKGDTEYRLSLIPLGGYVKMAGEMAGEGSGAPDEFCAKSPGQRAFVLVAGSAMNLVLALVGFILAFAIGVPFTVAEVGSLEKEMAAWEEGLEVGDRIVEINGQKDPDFEDVAFAVILGGGRPVALKVRRNGRDVDLAIRPRYDERVGLTRLGFEPPHLPIVTALYNIGGNEGRSPAGEAGVQVEDRIVQVNDLEVHTAGDVSEGLRKAPHDTLVLLVERDGTRLSFPVRTEPRYVIGVSGVGTTVKALKMNGAGGRIGLQVGDQIVRVNDVPVGSILEVEEAIRSAYGALTLVVEREGHHVALPAAVPDQEALEEFLFSIYCESSNTLARVQEGSPAWRAGMRSGDTIVEMDGHAVSDWEEVVLFGGASGRGPRLVRWTRGGAEFSALVKPEPDRDRIGGIGCVFGRYRSEVTKHGMWGSVKTGASKVPAIVAQIYLTIRGFIRGDISTRHTGSVILIAQSSYHAAREGFGKLLYLTAAISCMLGLLNVLPIPILDGGHILFVAIEKIRGKPVSEKVMAISSYVGLSVLLVMMLYALTNDILRLL